MRKLILAAVAAAAAMAVTAVPAQAQSSGRKEQAKKQAQMPKCTRVLGTIAMVEPEKQWWRELNLGSPEAILKVFVQESGCFTLVNRGRSLRSRAMERAMADSGELQAGSNMGGGQVRSADYFLEPDIVSSNKNSGGMNLGGIAGGLFGRTVGAIAGGINIKKKEANVTLSMVDSRSTEEYVVEGYSRKTDVGFGAGGGAGWWGGLAAAGGSSYQNTEIGQVIVLAYLDAYTKLVQRLGGI